MADTYPSTEVFVPGTYPVHTYNDRLSTSLREEVTKFITKGGGECLVVHGASKTGKTVLIERWLPPTSAIWIKGDEISSVEDLYRRVIDDLGLFVDVAVSAGATEDVKMAGGAEAGLSAVLKFRLDLELQSGEQRGSVLSRSSMPVSVVKEQLRRKPVPIVIDDFHFIDEELRLAVARAVKDLARITRVVMIAIPHAAFDPLKKLQDLDWRVRDLEVTKWKPEELAQIAAEGFSLLAIEDPGAVIGKRLADESRGAPAIMQVLCLEYVTEVLELWQTASQPVVATEPENWDKFLASVANYRRPSAFGSLIQGKDTRGTSRAARQVKDGGVTDIYGAIFLTLARMGVIDTVSKFDLAYKMAQYVEDSPKASVLGATLRNLADVAKVHRGQGDPAVSYQDPELQILDPFFAFYLAHGDWALPLPARSNDSNEQ